MLTDLEEYFSKYYPEEYEIVVAKRTLKEDEVADVEHTGEESQIENETNIIESSVENVDDSLFEYISTIDKEIGERSKTDTPIKKRKRKRRKHFSWLNYIYYTFIKNKHYNWI